MHPEALIRVVVDQKNRAHKASKRREPEAAGEGVAQANKSERGQNLGMPRVQVPQHVLKLPEEASYTLQPSLFRHNLVAERTSDGGGEQSSIEPVNETFGAAQMTARQFECSF